MSGSPELLEFYLVEATEYLDALDQLVAGTGGAPDGNAFIATARALRGTSTMAKADAIANVAAAVEQIAHALRDGEIRWTVDLFRSLRTTVDDLRFLVRGVRTWGEREGARAEARVDDLRRFLPNEAPRPTSPPAAATAPVFIALQSSAIAAELDAFVSAPQHRRALDDALARARTMRGVAGIGDFPPLADVADAVDRAGRALMPDAPLADAEIELFRAAADVLRRSSERLRDARPAPHDAPEVARFARAVAALETPTSAIEAAQRVLPIDELFYSDAGPHILQRGAVSPATRQQRFRDETSARAEHLRRLVGDARQVHDVAGRERATRVLRAALVDLQQVATSFDAHQVAVFFGDRAAAHALLDHALLDTLDAGALLLLNPGAGIEELERRLALFERSSRTPAAVAAVGDRTPARLRRVESEPAVIAPRRATQDAPSATPTQLGGALAGVAPGAIRRPPPTPTGRELQDLLQAGIAGFKPLDDEPLSEPTRLDEDEIVPIESLLYRGQSAVRRAIEIRDAMRARGAADDATLQEIYDLLDLAQAE